MPEQELQIARRSIWSGTLSFGLVSIPVSLFSAVRPRHTRLRMLDGQGTPLRRRYYCPESGKALDSSDLVKGYETEDSGWVTVEDEELEGLQPEKSGDIDLRLFVARQDIPPLYFNRPYFLFPSGRSVKAYKLLTRVLKDDEKAGIATFIMRGREYLVAILAEEGILWAETLRFAGELRDPEQVSLPVKSSQQNQVSAMEKEIRALSTGDLPAEEMADRYGRELERLAEKKRKRKKDLVRIEVEATETEGSEEPVDLMTILKQRLMEENAA